MARWEPDSRGRLARAALELYAERGFDHTTAAEIAQRAGVTERTFFRYFADKREVLFEGSIELQQTIVQAIAAAPPSMAPIDVVGQAMQSAGSVLGDRHGYARQRAAVITANPSLQERELLKLATLATAVTEALHRRGVQGPAAALVAETGVTVFRIGFENWIAGDPTGELARCIAEALGELRELTAGR